MHLCFLGHAKEFSPMSAFAPRFTITNRITAALTTIERARGFLEAATLSADWVRRMSQRALLVEAHATTHIEGTQLTIEEAERVWAGQDVEHEHGLNTRQILAVEQLLVALTLDIRGYEVLCPGVNRRTLSAFT